MLTIPTEIITAAVSGGVKSEPVATWLKAQLTAANVPLDASPAEWPADIWESYAALRTAAGEEPQAVSAKGLFESLST